MKTLITAASIGDPFNCPDCGAHDYGLFAASMVGCPHCLRRQRDDAQEWLWKLYEGIYGHRKAEGIDPFKTAVGGALELAKAWRERGEPAERAMRSTVERSIDEDVKRVMAHKALWTGLQQFRNGNWSEETLVRLICQLAAPLSPSSAIAPMGLNADAARALVRDLPKDEAK